MICIQAYLVLDSGNQLSMCVILGQGHKHFIGRLKASNVSFID